MHAVGFFDFEDKGGTWSGNAWTPARFHGIGRDRLEQLIAELVEAGEIIVDGGKLARP